MKRKIIITLIVMLAVGFAAVSTTLIINAIVGIGNNQDSFTDGVVFDEESLTSSDGTTAEISASGRTITFTTQEMKSVGEEAKVNFKIKNYSQYNAVLGIPAISCYYVDDYEVDKKANPVGTTHEYMKLIPGNELDGTTINAGGGLSVESSVTVKQIKSYVGETQAIKFQCEINARATDSETPSIEKTPSYNIIFDTDGGNAIDTNLVVQNGKVYGELPTPTKEGYEFLGWYTESGERIESNIIVNITKNFKLIAKWKNKKGYEITNDVNNNGTIDIGDEIKIGTESFYVISHTDTEINALAKYNLKVGNIYNGNTKERTILPTEKGYGRQDPEMRGWISGEKRYGTVKFSNKDGWPTKSTIDIKQYDGPVKEALYGENGYEKYIQETIPTATVRLITKEDIEALINDGSKISSATYIDDKADAKGYSWIYSTSYWGGSSSRDLKPYVWTMQNTNGYWVDYHYNFDDHYGIRPVITIPLG